MGKKELKIQNIEYKLEDYFYFSNTLFWIYSQYCRFQFLKSIKSSYYAYLQLFLALYHLYV